MDKNDQKNIYVVVPAYNEEKNIAEVLRDIGSYVKKIIVIDDGSSDRTSDVARNIDPDIFVIKHEINLGKGAAMKTGCEAAVSSGADYIVVIDSDGQHEGKDMIKMIDNLIENKLDIVFGERKFNANMPFMMKVGNILLTFFVKMFSNIDLSDTQCGLRAFTALAYEKIKWRESGYSVETEMIINAGKNNLKYGSTLIQTIYKDKYKGTTIIDGVIILFNMFKWKLK